MSKEIPLSQGKVAIVDYEDYEWLMQWKWHFVEPSYAGRQDYSMGRNSPILVRMHRLIMSALPSVLIDHINGDGLDNRRKNLRIATISQNGINRLKPSNNSSGYKGVTYRKNRRMPWEASVRHNKKQHYIGVFKTAKEAALAYDRKAGELFGQYARVNFG